MIQVNEGIVLDDHEIEERFVRASGPGGQNVRKEATAVELRLDIGASSLLPDVKERLVTLAGRAVTNTGVLVIVSRAHRSQAQNREAAHARLLALLRRAVKPPKMHKATKPATAVRKARLASKRLRSAVKQSRSRTQRAQD